MRTTTILLTLFLLAATAAQAQTRRVSLVRIYFDEPVWVTNLADLDFEEEAKTIRLPEFVECRFQDGFTEPMTLHVKLIDSLKVYEVKVYPDYRKTTNRRRKVAFRDLKMEEVQ